jgi:hypothetical protein
MNDIYTNGCLKMVNMSALKLGAVCQNCGSEKIAKAKDKTESYCKKCGTVVEELLHLYE